MRQHPVSAVAKQLLSIILSLIVIIPFVLILLNSVKTEGEAALMNLHWPSTFVWENYSIVVERGKLAQSFLNSTYYSVFTVLLVVAVTSTAAYVLARRKTRLSQALYFFLILGIVLPINFVALIKVMQVFRLINTRLGMVLLYASSGCSFSIFITTGFVGSVPRELDEAAIIDGAGPWSLFVRVILPLLKPVLVTVMVLQFLGTWNDFITPLYMLNRATMWPMTLAVYNFFGRYESSWNLVFADIVLTILPVFAIYLLGQRYIVSGMTSGALKG